MSTQYPPRSTVARCYGRKGVLARIGLKVQCHVCGRAYHSLGTHVGRVHRMTADEYRDAFGLRRATGLISPRLAEIRRRQCPFPSAPPRVRAARLSAARKARRWRVRPKGISLEERLAPDFQGRHARALAAAHAATRRAIANGTFQPPMHTASARKKLAAAAKKRVLVRDAHGRIVTWVTKSTIRPTSGRL